uniref:Uncharacterized protein n=1 Tax=Panagrellus redivivus TaxID=6233 RepID=A0A7E4ZU32_PANRE
MQFSSRTFFTFIMVLAFAIAMIHAEIDVGSPESANFIYPTPSRLNFQKKWNSLEPSIRFFKRSGYPGFLSPFEFDE